MRTPPNAVVPLFDAHALRVHAAPLEAELALYLSLSLSLADLRFYNQGRFRAGRRGSDTPYNPGLVDTGEPPVRSPPRSFLSPLSIHPPFFGSSPPSITDGIIMTCIIQSMSYVDYINQEDEFSGNDRWQTREGDPIDRIDGPSPLGEAQSAAENPSMYRLGTVAALLCIEPPRLTDAGDRESFHAGYDFVTNNHEGCILPALYCRLRRSLVELTRIFLDALPPPPP